jgi:hypothetical protein
VPQQYSLKSCSQVIGLHDIPEAEDIRDDGKSYYFTVTI